MQIDNGRLLNLKIKNIEKGHLASKNHCKGILNRIVQLINMKAISQPMCVVYNDPTDSSKNGVSGVIIIAESHVSVHCWLEDKTADLVINSCLDFSTSKVIEFCKEEFFTDDVFINVDFNKGGRD